MLGLSNSYSVQPRQKISTKSIIFVLNALYDLRFVLFFLEKAVIFALWSPLLVAWPIKQYCFSGGLPLR